jgi:hypothetical protein
MTFGGGSTVKRICAVFALGFALALAGGSPPARAEDGKSIELPAADRAEIEKYLGKDVVGKALEGNPIADAEKFFLFAPGSWTFKFTSGDKEGDVQEQSFKEIKKAGSGETGRYQVGKHQAVFVNRAQDGTISVVSEDDFDQGVVSHFSPPQPIYISGMAPGESKDFKIDVKVYDLSDPTEVTHTGALDLTYSYIGAYEVTVPAGTYPAALIKWVYTGKVGPAKIEDTQYRFLAEGAGVVAMIDKKDISALLIYHDDSKYGKVLEKAN